MYSLRGQKSMRLVIKKVMDMNLRWLRFLENFDSLLVTIQKSAACARKLFAWVSTREDRAIILPSSLLSLWTF